MVFGFKGFVWVDWVYYGIVINNILCNKLGNRERGQKEMNNVGFLFGGLVF